MLQGREYRDSCELYRDTNRVTSIAMNRADPSFYDNSLCYLYSFMTENELRQHLIVYCNHGNRLSMWQTDTETELFSFREFVQSI